MLEFVLHLQYTQYSNLQYGIIWHWHSMALDLQLSFSWEVLQAVRRGSELERKKLLQLYVSDIWVAFYPNYIILCPIIPCHIFVPGRVAVLDVVVDRSCFPCPRICRTNKHSVTRLWAAKVVVGQRTFAKRLKCGEGLGGYLPSSRVDMNGMLLTS